MKYSIIIPTFNNKVLLNNTLEALNFQKTAEKYEVIVVDDGSSDNTYEYIKQTPKNYNLKYFYLDRCEKSSRARTRNHGWKNANGEIIVFIDSDIIIKPDYLNELDRCYSVNKNIAVIGNRLMLNKPITIADIISGRIFHTYNCNNSIDLLESRYFLYDLTSYNINVIEYPWTQFYSCNAAVLKKHLQAIGGFDENFIGWGMEDIELGYMLYKHKTNIIINHKLEVLHQYHGKRTDLEIKEEVKPEWLKNIDYFLQKHPVSLNLPEKHKRDFLRGELKDDKYFQEIGNRYIGLDFKDKAQLNNLKKLILKALTSKKTIIVVNDYIENTDLDIWIQLPKENGKIKARYYPMSKKINKNSLIKQNK